MVQKKIEIILNGFKETVPERSSISSLIALFGERDPALIVEHNGQFVPGNRYRTTMVAQGDKIEFINPACGG